LGLALLGIVYTYLLKTPMNLDVALFLERAGRVFGGARLYIDLYENHPPTVFYLDLPAVALARLTGLPEIPVFYAYLIFLVVLSLWLCWPLIESIYQRSALIIRYCVLFSLIFISLIWPLGMFGQREHFLFILTIPYILGAMSRSVDSPLSSLMAMLIGVLAGIGLSIKPYYLIVWIVIEGYLIFGCKRPASWKRPENLAILSILIIFGLDILIWKPGFFKMVALARTAYGAYDISLIGFLGRSQIIIWMLAGFTLAFFKRAPQEKRPLHLLFLASTAFLLTAFIQRKGWANHMYPCLATAFLVICTAVFLWLEQLPYLKKHVWQGLSGCSLAFIFVLLALGGRHGISSHHLAQEDPVVELIPFVKDHAYGKPIYVMTTDVNPTFPLVNYSGTLFPYRFAQLWTLPGFYRGSPHSSGNITYHSPAEMEEFERLTFDTVIDDLLANPPALLIIDQRKKRIGFGKREFDFIAYFSQDSRFKRFLSQYKVIAQIDDFLIYQRLPDR
jgi:hypothetical protein